MSWKKFLPWVFKPYNRQSNPNVSLIFFFTQKQFLNQITGVSEFITQDSTYYLTFYVKTQFI